MTITSRYTVIHRTVDGQILDIINDFMTLEYTLTENDYGSLYLDLPDIYLPDHFAIDNRLEVVRTASDGINRIEGNKPFFIRLVRYKYDEDGKRYMHILAYDAVQLISRRIIAYPNNTSYSLKDGYADKILVELFRENCGDLVANLDAYYIVPALMVNRPFPTYAQHYAPASASGYSIKTDDMSRQLLLPRMQDICEMSRENDIYLSFDYIRLNERDLEFRTYLGQRGSNHGTGSSSRIIFSVDTQNLSYSTVEFDHTETKNFVYAGGRGQDANRVIETEADYEAWLLSPFNRCEDWLDVDGEDVWPAALEAAAVIKKRAPKTVFNGHIAQTPACIYGVHYQWGDLVTAVQDKNSFDVHLDTVNIKVSADGNEEINIYARNYDEGEY